MLEFFAFLERSRMGIENKKTIEVYERYLDEYIEGTMKKNNKEEMENE